MASNSAYFTPLIIFVKRQRTRATRGTPSMDLNTVSSDGMEDSERGIGRRGCKVWHLWDM